ncbi:FtsQ-type POTRA domain-containing protein [Leptospira sp. 96542]|nr:FtsQ-type POTRA domain-containing protein [Leptospira sp. 96542]
MVDTPPETAEKRFGRKLVVPLVLLVSGIIALGFVFRWGKPSKPIQKIVFDGLVVLTPVDVISYLGVTSEEGVGEDWKGYESKLSSHPRIRKIKVRRDPEGFLNIHIEERVAEFVVHIGSSVYEVDENLEILSENRVLSDHLIVITGNFPMGENKIEGTRILDITKEMRQALTAYPTLKTRISEILVEKDGEYTMFLQSPSRIKVYFGDKLNLYGIRKLYASLAYLEAESIQATTIDLRGEDAVYH